MPTTYDLQTSAVTLKGLTQALNALTWEGTPEQWGPTAALIRTINTQAKDLCDSLAGLPDET